MKKFNIICALIMVIMIAFIIYNFMALEANINPTYHRIMLVLDGILLGMAIGECWLGNVIVKNKCNFEKENK